MKGKLVLILFTFLLSQVYSYSICEYDVPSEFTSIIYLGLLMSIVYIGIKLILNHFIGNPQFSSSIYGDVMDLITSLAILMILPGLLYSTCRLEFSNDGVDLSNSPNLIQSTFDSTDKVVSSTLHAYSKIFNAVSAISMYSSYQIGVSFDIVSVFAALFQSFSSIVNLFNTLDSFLLNSYLSIVTYRTLLDITQSQAFIELLSVGLALRFIPFTRKVGGTLIAVVLGMSLIYPLVLNFMYSITPMDLKIPDSLDAYNPAMVATGLTASSVGIAILNYLYSLGDIPSRIVYVNSLIKASILIILSTYYIMVSFLLGIGKDIYMLNATYAVYSVFIPTIAILVTGASVRTLSRAIGAEVEIQGVMKVI